MLIMPLCDRDAKLRQTESSKSTNTIKSKIFKIDLAVLSKDMMHQKKRHET